MLYTHFLIQFNSCIYVPVNAYLTMLTRICIHMCTRVQVVVESLSDINRVSRVLDGITKRDEVSTRTGIDRHTYIVLI